MRRPLRSAEGPGQRRLAYVLTPALAALALAVALLAGPMLAASPAAAAAIGGSFALVDQDGRAVTDAQFRGKWLLVFFGYTHCPDVCPTALNTMAEALDALAPAKRDKVQPIFITVDPERDTPAIMKDYVGAFEGANIVGLTGTPTQVSAAEAAYQVHAERHDSEDGDYTMDHSSMIHIMDPDGHFVAMIYSMMKPERIAERLAQLVP
jgi:protein SCO1/2